MRKGIHLAMHNCSKSKNLALPLCLMAGAGAFLLWRSLKVKVPEDIQVVQNFDIHLYAGKWYEIARFDFRHEKHLSHVTADYSLNPDGSVRVVNTGFDYIKKVWKTSEGVATFVGSKTEGALKVSFFRPFYSGYNVALMDPDYENALIFGENKKYIWFLSRNKTMPQEIRQRFMDTAQQAGYDLDRLVWTDQR